jgi:molecular chaperone GrpE (heat shock protein)
MSEDEVRDKMTDSGDPPFTVIDRRPEFRDDAGAPAVPRLPTVVEELKARVEEAERRTREISSAYIRLEQERDAFRDRLQRDLERRVDIARAGIMRGVLGVLDDLDRAIAAAPTTPETPPLLQGVTITRDHLLQVLASEGVERVQVVGRPFDPAFAEAVETEPTEDPERDGIVIAELTGGFTLRGALLRPARVRVARRPASDSID